MFEFYENGGVFTRVVVVGSLCLGYNALVKFFLVKTHRLRSGWLQSTDSIYYIIHKNCLQSNKSAEIFRRFIVTVSKCN